MALDRSRDAVAPKNPFEYLNPQMMNRPAYLTIPAGSPMVGGDRPCLPVKPHLAQIIALVAARYGPIADYRILAGNVIGTGGWRDLPTERQYEAVTQTAGAFIASGMMYLEVTGPQAAALLDSLTPRNIAALPVGRAPFTIFTTPQGGVDEEALVLRMSEDRFLVSCGGGQAPGQLPQALARFPDVVVRDSELVSFNIKGPGRHAAMAALIAAEDRPALDALKPFHAMSCRTAQGDAVTVVRTVIGMEMWGAPDAVTAVWEHILTVPDMVLPCGWDLLDTYRMECDSIAFLLHPLDMNYATSLFDTGLDWMIDWSKEADYVGKAALIQLSDSAAEVITAKVIAEESRALPEIGEPICTADGRLCGHVTSAGYSYAAGRPIAYVHLSRAAFTSPDALSLAGWRVLPNGGLYPPVATPTSASATVMAETRH